MDLFIFLVITILLCSLILLVQDGESRWVQVLAVAMVTAEVFYILIAKDTLSIFAADKFQKLIPCFTALTGLICLSQMKERAVPLLIFFTSLLQIFVEMGIIKTITSG